MLKLFQKLAGGTGDSVPRKGKGRKASLPERRANSGAEPSGGWFGGTPLRTRVAERTRLAHSPSRLRPADRAWRTSRTSTRIGPLSHEGNIHKIQRNKPVPNKNKAVDPSANPPPFRKFSAVSDLSESPLRATTHLRSACRPARQHPFCARPHAMTNSVSPVPLSVSCERTEKPSR